MVFVKKETEVEKLVMRHFTLVEQVLGELVKMLDDYFAEDRSFKADSSKIDQLEHEADGLRRDIECKLYEGAFLPIYREDYIMLVEQLDEVANKTEAAADFIMVTRPRIPQMVQQDLREIAQATLDAFKIIMACVETVMKDPKKAFAVSQEVQRKEAEVDEMVWQMTKKVFKSKIEKAEKLHVKMLIDRTATISNRIEDTADRLVLMAVKRNV